MSRSPLDSTPRTVDLETAIALVNDWLQAKTGKPLNSLQATILRGAWLAVTYETIAQNTPWSEAHIKAVGADLWASLSAHLEEAVTKKNFRATIERRAASLRSAIAMPPPSQPDVSVCLEFPDGPVQLTSDLYCDRPPIETQCYRAITQPGALLRIRAPRQMGKTSLLMRLLKHVESLGYVPVSLNLQLVDAAILQDLDRFLQWFSARVTQVLNLPLQVADYWDDIFGSKTSCKDYFENYLLPQCAQPLVIALDDVDTLFTYPATADGFFALLRAWYEEAKSHPRWQLLRLILVHSTDVYVPLQINQSPFNVGIPIELPDFNTEQVIYLAQRHGLNWSEAQVDLLMHQVSGHPYLVRLALYYMACAATTLEDLVENALTLTSPFHSHLQRQAMILAQSPTLITTLQAIASQSQPPPYIRPLELSQLHRLGLIQVTDGQVVIRGELYRRWLQAIA
ncbi:AAA-like domain-containing protein [Trichothermofontia sp.]